ncbi:hypothetical protein DI392_15525 [Vibrio albus]|uniref:EAL domain-containing protein n=1 Tax=Vibrio albus TaxID=2200953 RepID=A0A2U3B6N7_9VIBR|nr:EAL domain-containing protein [Vibrio albus]PWI32463.1 hypothetical protein DI392_15525 [Vibrio albus]
MSELEIETNFKSSSAIGLNGSNITWSLNYETRAFQILKLSDDAKLNQVKHITIFEDFLECFKPKERFRFKQHVNNIRHGKKPKAALRTLLSLDEQELLYCTISASRISDSIVHGNIILLFKLPKRSEFSTFFLSIFDNRNHGVVLTDKRANIVACNQCYEESMGYTIEELIGKNTNIFKSGKFDEIYYVDMWATIHYMGHWFGNILSKRKDGSIVPHELTIQTLNFNKSSTYYLGITRELTNIPVTVSPEERYGGVELLTQLPNEVAFLRKTGRHINEMPEGNSLFLMIMDPELSDEESLTFKIQMSKALSQNNDHFYGGYIRGNRFALAVCFDVVSGNADSSIPHKELSNILSLLKHNLPKAFLHALSVSNIGVSVLGTDGNSANELYEHATIAMEESHRTKISNICLFDKVAHYQQKRRRRLEALARQGIRTRNVDVFYQPIVDTVTWKVRKVEALCRFRDQNGGLLNTQEMVNIIEDLGLVEELDLIVAERAITERALLTQKFGSDIEICLNVSLNTTSNNIGALSRLQTLLDDLGADAGKVTIEITESAYFGNSDEQMSLITAIKQTGVSVAIDDFGTGYSSFSYLKEPAFDILKIDREFVSGLNTHSRYYHIIKMIVDLAHKLGIQIVAEGVESREEATLLYDMGVDMLQGYYFSQPMSVTALKPLTSLLYRLRKTIQTRELTQLVTQPLVLEPNTPLEDIKNVFETTPYEVLPVIEGRKCVGLVDKPSYYLHISSTLGTDLETARDLAILKKRALQIMDPLFEQMDESITISDVVDNLQQGKRPPWVVVNQEGKYLGLIEQDNVLNILVQP